MNKTHEEYIDTRRKRVAEVSQGMIDGSIHYLEGSIELSRLRFEVNVPEDDKDFLALDRHEPEIQRYIEWAKNFSLSECKSLLERFR